MYKTLKNNRKTIVAHAIAIFSCARLPLCAKKNRVFLEFESQMTEEPLLKAIHKIFGE